MGDGVGEAEHIGVEAETAYGVVAIAILDVATDGMAQVGAVDTDLILSARLQSVFYQGMGCGAVEDVVMGDGIFAPVIYGGRVGEVGLVVLQPARHRTLVVHHFAADHRHIAAIIDQVVPFVLKNLLGAHVFGIDHQSRGVAVQTVDDVGITLLSRLPEIAVEDGLDVERGVACRHG